MAERVKKGRTSKGGPRKSAGKSAKGGASKKAVGDVKRDLKALYLPSDKEVVLVDVPEMAFLMVDGIGDPNTSKEFQDGVQALYSLAYTLKFMLKKEGEHPDWKVPPLEGLWWTREEGGGFDYDARETWRFRLMIMQPDHVKAEHVERAKSEIEARSRKKKEPVPAGLGRVRLERFREGPSVQIMHIGPYRDEPPRIVRMHERAKGLGMPLRGKHHEIYLSDPRRVPEAKWRTVLRQPVGKV
jgi:hypothetical protein